MRGVELVRHIDMHICRRTDRTAASPGKRHCLQPARFCNCKPASTFADEPLVEMPTATSPGRPKRFDLPRKHSVESVIVGNRGDDAACRSSAQSPAARAVRAGTGRPARTRSAARLRRCRRCRRSAPSPRYRTRRAARLPPRPPPRTDSRAACSCRRAASRRIPVDGLRAIVRHR